MCEDALEHALTEVLRGNREAYRQVIELSEMKVRLTLAALLPHTESLEDLAQETFLVAYRNLREFSPGTDFFAWIGTIARNLAYNERKRWYRELSNAQRYRIHLEQTLEARLPQLETRLNEDLYPALRECIGSLQAQTQSVLHQHYFEGLSHHEIASRHGRSAEWTRLVLFRARAALASCMSRKGAPVHG